MEEPFFLLLGQSDHEGVTSKLKASRIYYLKKLLDSKLSNWDQIFDLIESENVLGIIVKLTNSTMGLMSSGAYENASIVMFHALSKKEHIIFVHDSFFTKSAISEDDLDDEDYRRYFGSVTDEEREFADAIFAEFNMNIVPYSTNAEVTTIALDFIENSQRNVLFRVYIPRNRMWATEAEKIIDLFRDYLSRVSGLNIRQDRFTTSSGQIYEFTGDASVTPSELPAQFADFSRFVELCVSNPGDATLMLAERSVGAGAAREIVDRYSKEARRLNVDLRQERERRLLSIRHRMEAELSDIGEDELDWRLIDRLVDACVPKIGGVSGALGFGGSDVALTSAQSVTVNIRPQIVQSVRGIVAQEISGTQNFGPEMSDFLDLIRRHGGNEASQLTSDLYEFEDGQAKPSARLTAKGRLTAFLYKVGAKIGDAGAALLLAYVEKKLGVQ